MPIKTRLLICLESFPYNIHIYWTKVKGKYFLQKNERY